MSKAGRWLDNVPNEFDNAMLPTEELSPSAVEGRASRQLRVEEDDDDGRIVESINPPGPLPRNVEWNAPGGTGR